jgi:hypothetical protein
MNEYLSKLYDWISSQDPTFQARRPKEEFISKMENDADYNQQMYTWQIDTPQMHFRKRQV